MDAAAVSAKSCSPCCSVSHSYSCLCLVLALWNFYYGGHFHVIPGWSGNGFLHSTAAGGDYFVLGLPPKVIVVTRLFTFAINLVTICIAATMAYATLQGGKNNGESASDHASY